MSSAIRTTYQLLYQISPIFLSGGLFSSYTIGNLIGFPLVGLTEGLSLTVGDVSNLLRGNYLPITNQGLDTFFCTFKPLPGSTLIKNEVSMYPFYTQQIAANAQIQSPLNVSMIMYCPMSDVTPYTAKLSTMLALQQVLQNHTNAGGTYTVLTPSGIYQNCLLTALTDVSTGETSQTQFAYQWDFIQPLTTFPTFNITNATAGNGGTTSSSSAALSYSSTTEQTTAAIQSAQSTSLPLGSSTTFVADTNPIYTAINQGFPVSAVNGSIPTVGL